MFISEIIETLEHASGDMEVCVTAEAEYSPSDQKVSVALGSFARIVSASGDGEHQAQTWLPPDECVTEHLDPDAVTDFAKDVFKGWVKKVHATIPHELNLKT